MSRSPSPSANLVRDDRSLPLPDWQRVKVYRQTIIDPKRFCAGGWPREIVALAWKLHHQRNNGAPSAGKTEAELIVRLARLGVPLDTVPLCPHCGQDLPRSEVEP